MRNCAKLALHFVQGKLDVIPRPKAEESLCDIEIPRRFAARNDRTVFLASRIPSSDGMAYLGMTNGGEWLLRYCGKMTYS